ncbi:MAG: hypothetical protein HYV09_34155 [Deltaproteobacteria bacterium]|nr:hypothetical protein [Deltaproteobacteria bacterium]
MIAAVPWVLLAACSSEPPTGTSGAEPDLLPSLPAATREGARLNAEWYQSWATGEVTAVVATRDGGAVVAGLRAPELVDATHASGAAFVMKLDAAGSIAWTRALSQRPRTVVELPSGDLALGLVAGGFDGPLGDGYGGAAIELWTGAGARRWSRVLSRSAADRVDPRAMTIDSAGDVVMVAACRGTLRSDDVVQPCPGDVHLLVLKIGNDGALRFVRAMAAINEARRPGEDVWMSPTAVTVDAADHVIVAGQYGGGRIELGTATLPKASRWDAFLLELDAQGAPVRGKSFPADAAWISGMSFDRARRLLITGGYALRVELDGETRTAPFGGSDGPDAAGFVALLDSSWARVWDREWYDASHGDRVWAGGDAVLLQGVWGGGRDGWDPRLWVARLRLDDGTVEASYLWDNLGWNASHAALAPDGALFVAGGYVDTIDFGLGPLPQTGSELVDAMYVVKLR